MFPKIDVATAESLAKSMTFLLLSYIVTLIGATATVIALGLVASQIHIAPWMSGAIAVCVGFVVWGTNLLGIHLFNKSEASL